MRGGSRACGDGGGGGEGGGGRPEAAGVAERGRWSAGAGLIRGGRGWVMRRVRAGARGRPARCAGAGEGGWRPGAPALRGKECESTRGDVLMFWVSEGAGPERERGRKANPMRGWRNRQTRWIQVPVPARAWGFNSPLAHREERVASRRCHPFFVCVLLASVCGHSEWSPGDDACLLCLGAQPECPGAGAGREPAVRGPVGVVGSWGAEPAWGSRSRSVGRVPSGSVAVVRPGPKCEEALRGDAPFRGR